MSDRPGSLKVLLVDDEEDFVEVLSQRLETRGITTDTAQDGIDALRKIEGRSFDAIVLDLRMPGMDGIETLQRMRGLDPDLQIILLTGRATLKDGIEAMKQGAMEFLEKPVDMAKLVDILKEAQDKKLLLTEKRLEDKIKDILDSKGW
ncbi:response regulator [Planctomycetota bacterium]